MENTKWTFWPTQYLIYVFLIFSLISPSFPLFFPLPLSLIQKRNHGTIEKWNNTLSFHKENSVLLLAVPMQTHFLLGHIFSCVITGSIFTLIICNSWSSPSPISIWYSFSFCWTIFGISTIKHYYLFRQQTFCCVLNVFVNMATAWQVAVLVNHWTMDTGIDWESMCGSGFMNV